MSSLQRTLADRRSLWTEWADTGFAIAFVATMPAEDLIGAGGRTRTSSSTSRFRASGTFAISSPRCARRALTAGLTRQLCERIEIVPESLPDTSDVSPIQKALLSGYFSSCATLSRTGDSVRRGEKAVPYLTARSTASSRAAAATPSTSIRPGP